MESPCVCFPYNDGVIIAAQVIAIVAFLISWIWWVTFAISLIGMVLLQVIWCCRQNKLGILTSAIVSGIAALMNLFSGIWVLIVWKKAKWGCYPFALVTDDFYDDDDVFDHDYCPEGVWGGIALFDMVLWLIVTVLILNFLYGGNFQKWESKLSKKATADGVELPTVQGQIEAVAMEECEAIAISKDQQGDVPEATTVLTSDAYKPPEIADKTEEV